MSEVNNNPYQPRNLYLRKAKNALRNTLNLIGPGRDLVLRYPKLKEHGLMHWLRIRRTLWPWMRKPWILRKSENSNVYITSKNRYDGAGSQILAVLSNICFAEFAGLKYTHTPFHSMSHAPEGMTNEQCADEWERSLDLGRGALLASELRDVKRKHVRSPQQVSRNAGMLFEIDNCHAFTDRYPEVWESTMHRLKRQRWRKPDPSVGRSIIVASHARRGDVPQSERLRYTTNDQLYRTLSMVQEEIQGLGLTCELHLYSEGSAMDFTPLRNLAVNFHLNGNQIADWNALRAADVLIVSRSAFSFSAALLSDGIIVCPRFWHEPLKNWVRMDKAGKFQVRRLQSKINALNSTRRVSESA